MDCVLGKTQIFIFQWFLKAFPGNYALFEDNLYPSSNEDANQFWRSLLLYVLMLWCSFLSAYEAPSSTLCVMHSWAYDWWHFMLISYSKSLIIILLFWSACDASLITIKLTGFYIISGFHFYQKFIRFFMMNMQCCNCFNAQWVKYFRFCPKKFLGWKTCQKVP